MIEVPEDIDVEAPEVPYATPIAPGESFAETVIVPLPIDSRDPYRQQPAAESPSLVDRFTFALGYIVDDQPLNVAQTKLSSGDEAWRVDYADLAQRQRLRVSDPVAISLPVSARVRIQANH